MVYRGINNNAGGTGIDTSIGGRVNLIHSNLRGDTSYDGLYGKALP